MRFLVALAFLLGVAYASNSITDFPLKYPGWIVGKTHLYDTMINLTSQVPGLSPQVSKAVIKTEVKIFAKSEKELIIQMHKVRVSNSISGVGSISDDVPMHSNRELEESLKVPMKAVFENGMVKTYTMDPRESLESQKIKRSILRNLELYIDEEQVKGTEREEWPKTYNLTRSSPAGNYVSHYVITSSPYPDFPKEWRVFNVSRTDNFEVISYLAYKTHHNYAKQGCPEVCSQEHVENRFGAGCPVLKEPYHTPIKRSFVQTHNLKKLRSGELIIDIVRTTETHIADVLDQKMQIDITTFMQISKATPEQIPEPRGQQTHTDLNDLSKEINEPEIQKLCKYPDTTKLMQEVKHLLEQVAEIVIKEEVKDEQSKKVGELLVAMQRAMQNLKRADLRTLQRDIVNYDEMKDATDKERIKRQVWLDMLPLIGSSESVSFIVQLISENMVLTHKYLSLWESTSILENLPRNIHLPTEETIRDLSRLLEILKDRKTPGYTFFYSAAHLTVARVISDLCSNTTSVPETADSSSQRSNRIRDEQNDRFVGNMDRVCPKTEVQKFIRQIAQQLETTDDKSKRVIYIETLARTGLEEVLSYLKPYIYGQTGEINRSVPKFTRSYTDFLKTVSIYSLHNVVRKVPTVVQNLLIPVFMNKTEPPKVRTAAFSVIMRSQPTLGLLQQVAEQSWFEPSREVASFVYSTLENIGNSSLPCQQLTASRIKKVLPQVRLVDYGNQKSRSKLYDLWDDVRGFGFESTFSFTASNESFIPSAMYSAFSYNVDTLKDYFFKNAFNTQGLTSRNLYDTLMKTLGLTIPEDIPRDILDRLFSDMSIVARDPEPWRFTSYETLFYSSSFYYFDAEETSHQDIVNMIIDQIRHYIRPEQGYMTGHLVKVFIPSSYHVRTIGQSLPYPIAFEIKNPMLLSLKLKVQTKLMRDVGSSWEVHLNPSAYYSTIYSNEILNLGDCKKIGVYQTQKSAVTYPIVITAAVESQGNVSFSYKFPQLPKNIYSYRSEAGTHATKNYIHPLPSDDEKKTIKTIPAQFVKPISWGVIGLPRFAGEIKTEDIQLGTENPPRTVEEATWFLIKHIRNVGWRRKSVDIARVPDSSLWIPNSEVKMLVNMNRLFVSHPSTESDWSSDLKFDDNLDKEDTAAYAAEGQKIYQKLSRKLSHIKDVIKVTVQQKIRSSIANRADMHIEYSRTLGGFLHFVRFNASAALPKIFAPISVTADYVIAFTRRPNEFKYSEGFGKQKGLLLGAVSFSRSTPFFNPTVIAKAVFDYKPLEQVLHMESTVPSKYFEPETHEQCLRDISKGKSLSEACVKAIKEKSIYNNIRLHTVWVKESPELLKEVGTKIDIALKHAFYTHLNITRKRVVDSNRFKHLRLEATYIDKMTDEPVIDLVVEKPSEIISISKINSGIVRPMSSIDSLVESYISAWTNNTYPATCSLMEKQVRTFDLKTYPLPIDTPDCEYILTTHCTENKKFAVIVKYSPETPGTPEIEIYLGKDKIVLVPGSHFAYRVKYNEREETVRPLAPLMLSESKLLTALVNIVNDGQSFVEINARKTGIKIRYDGVRVTVQLHPRYKGEVCGLCSEFNGEKVREFRGVDRCLYTHPYDFAKSSILGTCTDKRPAYNYMCNNDEVSFSWGEHKQHESGSSEHEEQYGI